jgi:D-beta-D-heptose 7-phosphate kinase / D-beta-D-heptose 1-phosphate adenosyltransferase
MVVPFFFERDDLAPLIASLKGQTLVFTNGCFDLLHVGHARYLREASRFGDVLVVGINSDASVRRLKGDRRPIVGEQDRAEMVLSLKGVDFTVIFEQDTPLEIIQVLHPKILVKGADWDPKNIVGASLVQGWGGEVKTVTLAPGRSTTSILEKMETRQR